MYQRHSMDKSQQSTTTIRRSPRLLQQNQPNTDDDSETPKPESRRMRVSHSDLTPLSSVRKGSLSKSQKQRRSQVSEKGVETHLGPKSFTKLSTEQRRPTRLYGVSKDSQCLRRSPRFSEDYNVKVVGFDKTNQEDFSKTERYFVLRRNSDSEIGRRVTRSSIRGGNEEGATGIGKGCNGVNDCISGEVVGVQCKSNKGKVKAGVNLSKQCLYKIEKRVTRSASRRAECENIQKCGDVKGDKPIQHASLECLDEGALSHEGKGKLDVNLSKKCTTEPVNRRKCKNIISADSSGGGDRKGFANEVEENLIRVKRRRAEAKEGHGIAQGWTREQELTLQRAYFAAKPTPHFWKKVSKMVPGKSAQDCFNKIHSDHLTPPQPQPRSRAKATSSSSLSFSASILLSSSQSKRQKLRHSKQKSFLSHKAVRELLQKQCKIDQNNEADIFTVLEPTLDPSIRIIPDGALYSTPECNKIGPGFLKRCLERSSSACRQQLSRSNASCGDTLTSHPVLKQVKNKALHEKYIDQLHTREAKRQAASLRATKCIQRKNDAQRSEVVKATKDALIFYAREAINQYHHLQKGMTNNDNVYDDFADGAEDDIEDGS